MEWRLPRWNANIQDSRVSGLFQGHFVMILRAFPYAAVKVMAYDRVYDVRPPILACSLPCSDLLSFRSC